MKRKRSNRDQMLELCGELGPEDGIDPRDFFKPARKESHRKNHQLCRQVAETLNVEIASLPNPPLNGVAVAAVRPAPDSSHLLVLVAPLDPHGGLDGDDVLAALYALSGRLRTAVAAAITRKRVPQLSYRYLPTGMEGA